MPIPNLIIIVSFILLGASMLMIGIKNRRQGINSLGQSTIASIYFATGKVSLFLSWTLLLVKAMFPKWTWNPISVEVAWIAALLSCVGTIIMIVALFKLGSSLRVGLPSKQTILQTTGIFRLSRNPIYLGVFLICIASCLFFPNPINIALVLYGMFVHHQIILGEEKFLAERFGEAWKAYISKVRRYI